ncbi:exonuclease 1 isoform X1 [Myotis daubentonii]|uniref:exonuclease 1 isoform X1 n=1 Tax=Myotis daubentonii TaxID=98922 RepID=UPI002872B5A4|nr:exonuclease 1 isoform X1 [Myotis daubentonii]XP_059533463.1 exonuclease 1 isoform X1 [Myotis daubentonii]
MGIQGLLQFIKDASEPIHVRKYKGQVVAVDTYCWLHKGAIACAEKLAKGEPTDKYVGFCMKFVNMLLSHGIKPILVFDGCTLPSKKEVEKSRRERRQANLLKGKQLLREGKVSEARECFTRCVNITPAMAHNVIKAARAQGVDCLVAPYEADAQLAYLNKAGIVQAIVTEDSDLLAFGCKKVILKMDQFGNGLEIDQARLGMCRQLGDVFTEEKFRYMCILSGCDYLSSLRGIGLAKACKVLRLANNPDIVKVIKKLGHYLKMNITVPEDYIKGFIRANNTFLYQLVFDPIRRKLVPLNDYGDDVDPAALSYAGRYIDDSLALQIALGNKDINTFEQIDDYNPDTATPALPRSRSWDDSTSQKPSGVHSIWHRNYCPGPERAPVPGATRLKANPSTAGREQVVSTKGLTLPRKLSIVKRPRGEEMSEDDLLSQYSLSFTKKTKKDGCEGSISLNSSKMLMPDLVDGTTIKKTLSTPPTTRNKFAAFLQRKNQESGAVVVPGTRSRFFCNSLDSMDCVSKKASPQHLDETADTDKKTNLNESDCLDDKKVVDLNESDCLEGKELVDLNESDCLESKMLGELNQSDCLESKMLGELNQSDCLEGKVLGELNQSDCLESKMLGELNQSDCLEGKVLGELNQSDCLESKKLVDLNESDCLEGKKLVERNVAHTPSDQTPDGVTVIADEESPSFKTVGFTKTISPPTLGTLRSCFSWSGSLGDFSRTPSPSPSTALHQFRRRGGSPSSLPGSTVSDAPQVKGDASGDEALPVHELSWSSQSLESAELSPRSSSASTLPQPSRKDCSPEESDCNFKSLANQGNQKPKLRVSHFSKKDTLLRNKVPGLYRSGSLDSLSTTKIKALVPARASGLSKRPARVQKRKHHNAENKPGLQTKINELWKNFGFKKDSEKLPSCKKPDPLSPVKDNIQLTPETDEDIFHKPESARVQRAIFQ